MRLKILASVSLAAALGLVGCSGNSSTSSSSSASSSTTTTTSAAGTTTATHGSTSTGSTGTTATHSSSTSTGTSTGTSSGTTSTTASNASSSSGSGTTGTPSSGSSTGTTVTTSTTNASTSGSSGGTSGGTVDTDCGTGHASCADGTHCTPFGGQGGITQYYACACTQEDSQAGTTDSCRDTNDIPGGNGKVVCDGNTYDCRAPRDYEQIFDYATTADEACAANFTYVHFVNGLPDGGQTGYDLPDGGIFPDFPDGGLQLLCLENCVAGTQGCSANWTHCEAGALVENLPDGGQNPIDSCVENDCGPDLTFNAPDGGTYTADAGAYYGACDSDGQTGSCQPLPSSAGNKYIGVCFKVGTAAAGQACSGFFGLASDPSTVCAANELCFGTGLAPGGQLPPAYCLQVCDAAQLTAGLPDCQNIGSIPTTCTKFSGDPTGTDLQAGYCN